MSVCLSVSHVMSLHHSWFKYSQPEQWHWIKYLNTPSQGSGPVQDQHEKKVLVSLIRGVGEYYLTTTRNLAKILLPFNWTIEITFHQEFLLGLSVSHLTRHMLLGSLSLNTYTEITPHLTKMSHCSSPAWLSLYKHFWPRTWNIFCIFFNSLA